MASASWLSLIDYSSKYSTSLSTLRRRIKAESVNYQLKSGKYFLLDHPLDTQEMPRQTTHSTQPTQIIAEPAKEKEILTPRQSPANWDHTVELLGEIKKAYRLVLQEKEEQIQILKDEISDLQTLVQALETENKRLNRPSIGIDRF